MLHTSKLVGAAFGVAAGVLAGPAAAVVTVGMDFLDPGSPATGTATINGVGVTVQGGPGSQTGRSQLCVDVITGCPATDLVTDARLNFATGAAFDVNRFVAGQTVSDAPESFLTFSFDTRVREITFEIARLAPNEIVETDLGVPDAVTGELALGGPGGFTILAAGSGDLNDGLVTYTGLNASSFTIFYGTNGTGSGIPGDAGIIGIGVAPVPVPPALSVLGLALGGTGAVAAVRRRRAGSSG